METTEGSTASQGAREAFQRKGHFAEFWGMHRNLAFREAG